jgi:hypothetical protein
MWPQGRSQTLIIHRLAKRNHTKQQQATLRSLLMCLICGSRQKDLMAKGLKEASLDLANCRHRPGDGV